MGLAFRALDGGRSGAWSLQHRGSSLGVTRASLEFQLVELAESIDGSDKSADDCSTLNNFRASNYRSTDNSATDHINSADDRSAGAEDFVRRW